MPPQAFRKPDGMPSPAAPTWAIRAPGHPSSSTFAIERRPAMVPLLLWFIGVPGLVILLLLFLGILHF